MTELTLDAGQLAAVLKLVAADIKTHVEELRELDSITGDGDLGITMGLVSQALLKSLQSAEIKDIGKMLAGCAMNINASSPSTFGTLLSTAFMGGGKAVLQKEQIAISDIGLMLESAIEAIRKRGKSAPGDKTLLDTLVPALEAFKAEMAASGDVIKALKAADAAALAGMQSTKDMPAKFGRASYRPDRSVGIQDAGATAMYYILNSFIRNLLASVEKNKGLFYIKMVATCGFGPLSKGCLD